MLKRVSTLCPVNKFECISVIVFAFGWHMLGRKTKTFGLMSVSCQRSLVYKIPQGSSDIVKIWYRSGHKKFVALFY